MLNTISMDHLPPRPLRAGRELMWAPNGVESRSSHTSVEQYNSSTQEAFHHDSLPYVSGLSRSAISARPIDVSNSSDGKKPSRDNCDRRRPYEEESSRLPAMSQHFVGQTAVQPYLKEHIPSNYAPMSGKVNLLAMASSRTKTQTQNSKFCYRHRPDSKCRKAADESKMSLIQQELETLSEADQQAIANVWTTFSAAPIRHRELMLQGLITQCCFPQLSMVSREVSEQLKIDFLSALPTELAFKILSSLDCVSLCKAAQVSRRWRTLADDDLVWHRMCEQHIDRKCTSCGWGLPRLEKRRLKDWKKQFQQAQNTQRQLTSAQDENATRTAEASVSAPATTSAADPASALAPVPAAAAPSLPPTQQPTKLKRNADFDDSHLPKKSCSKNGVLSSDHDRAFRAWKDVYRDRFKVGSNWKYGRCSIKTFRGAHTNGVTCLQFDDNILATGSYDSTIKLWDVERCEVIRTLEGHHSGIRALQFDDRILVSGSLDGTVKIWNWRTGVCLNSLTHNDAVISVHMDGDWLASGSMDQSIKIFNFKTGKTFSLLGHTDYVNQVKLDLASRTLLSASDDCTVKLWDLDSRTCIKTYDGHVGQVQQVLPLPDDYEFEDEAVKDSDVASVTSNLSGTPAPDAQDQPKHSTPPADERLAYGWVFEQDLERQLPPRYMLTGSLDATMRLWDTASGRCLRTFFGHVEGIWSLVGDSLRYVTGANDATVKVWDPKSGRCERTFTGHAGPVTCVGLSDSRMASGGEDGEVRLYRFDSDASEAIACGTPS